MTVSSVSPPSGIEDLAAALDDHHRALDLAERRPLARRAAALREFTAEHGDAGLRALGGRRAAERLLAAQEPGTSVNGLIAALEEEL